MTSPIQKLKEFVAPDDDDIRRPYLCHGCDNQFMSAKQPQRVQCPECLGNDVDPMESR